MNVFSRLKPKCPMSMAPATSKTILASKVNMYKPEISSPPCMPAIKETSKGATRSSNMSRARMNSASGLASRFVSSSIFAEMDELVAYAMEPIIKAGRISRPKSRARPMAAPRLITTSRSPAGQIRLDMAIIRARGNSRPRMKKSSTMPTSAAI